MSDPSHKLWQWSPKGPFPQNDTSELDEAAKRFFGMQPDTHVPTDPELDEAAKRLFGMDTLSPSIDTSDWGSTDLSNGDLTSIDTSTLDCFDV
jgi:hypothetical protein